MDTLLLTLALVSLACLAYPAVGMAVARRAGLFLRDTPPAGTYPRVSVVIPARDEERTLEQALLSVLGQDYPNMEVIVVDDRSTDATPAILDRMYRKFSALRIIQINELPEGWIGKNHAVYRASLRATGEYLLFTDADVVMERSALSRAIRYMEENGIDHLAVAPRVEMRGVVLNMFAGAFMLFFSMYARPWLARDPKSGAYIGIGAFNLVKREVYLAVGTHRAIAMRPDEDMRLAGLVKGGGYRQGFLSGKGLLSVEWYPSLGMLINGLEKNSFAAVDYRLSLLVVATLASLLLFVWPFLAPFLTTGATRLVNCAVLVVMAVLYRQTSAVYGIRSRYGLGLPLATLLFIHILWRSAIAILCKGGVEWRGTRYPLERLRRPPG